MKKIWCLDCEIRMIDYPNSPYYTTDDNMKPLYDALAKHDTEKLCGHWNPEFWVGDKYWQGFERNWGDASVGYRSDFKFEVLKKVDKEHNKAEFLILCPTLLRRPLRLDSSYDPKWGFSAHGSY